MEGRIDLLNRKGEIFDWDNNNLVDLQAIDKQPQLIHPDIISEIPGVKTVDLYNHIIGPTPIVEEEKPPLYDERAAKGRKKCRPRY